jgi:superfamily II DNA helicase RecQ
MSALPPPFDWSKRLQYDWTSQEGLNKLKGISLKYDPQQFQLYDSGCILNRMDIFCISATGDGKSALIYIPTLARPQMITIVIKLTNFLETNMVHRCKIIEPFVANYLHYI